jgi:hypothetical protein
VIAVQMDRLCHINIANDIATVQERHHCRNLLNLTPGAYPEALDRVTRRTGHHIRTSRPLREGCTHRCCAFASRQRGEFTARQDSQRRARSSKPHAQRKSITNWCGEREAPSTSRCREAATGTARLLQLATAAGVPSGSHNRICWEANRAPRANQIHTPALYRFAQRLKCIAPEFTNLIQEQEPSMRPRQLTWRHTRTAANEPSNCDVMMRSP